jgi:hypothetical protein
VRSMRTAIRPRFATRSPRSVTQPQQCPAFSWVISVQSPRCASHRAPTVGESPISVLLGPMGVLLSVHFVVARP